MKVDPQTLQATSIERLTTGTGLISNISLSPDGRTIAAVTNEAGVGVLRLYDADTRRELGHYLEYMYQTEAGRDLFVQVPRF